jgi:hypothetical protein
MKHKNIGLIGIAPWRLVLKEPRHNTWHMSLIHTSQRMELSHRYFGLKHNFESDWIFKVFEDGVLRKFPYISLINFFRIIKAFKSEKIEKQIIYIFEGSFFWLLYIKLMCFYVPNSILVCNLFPSSGYATKLFRRDKLKIGYFVLFKFLKLMRNSIVITFDTQLMVDKVNKFGDFNIVRFPVPSSFDYRTSVYDSNKSHFRVLVNIRAFDYQQIHILMQNSCKMCTFVFPRGPLKTTPLRKEFGRYPNAHFDEEVIGVDQYQNYIDAHDYMIFLYKPSIDASGRILDCITRSIPLCVPMQATEWSLISKTYGHSCLYDYHSMESIIKVFNHPNFLEAENQDEPPFTPKNVVLELNRMGLEKDLSQIKLLTSKKVLAIAIVIVHSTFAFILSLFYSGFFRLSKKIKKLE